ncbi:MAG: inorganic phosphate transporter [Bacteroidales bacterium]
MESFYIALVVILFLLAISDLIVGVSNDAVNFLNSAIGAKIAPFRIIMIVAAAGVLFGATFSGGMMEVARKGIFNPAAFSFAEIMILFLAVMMTDVILLDVYNTFGLPTSTTVSIVFELLGAAVGLSVIKAINEPEVVSIGHYINSGSAMGIIFGILLSVVIAFVVGAIVQYFTRLLFSFNFEKNMKRWGSIFGGVAITAITFFILIKGAKGATFMTDATTNYLMNNSTWLMAGSFVFWSVLLQLLSFLFKADILKIIILVGTFALAMAFAGNDLVNFIGVPLAGLSAFKSYIAANGQSASEVMMSALNEPVQTNTLYLIAAGIFMVIALWTSRKARSVVNTSIDLSRQNEGVERFGSSTFSRAIVRRFIAINKTVSKAAPTRLRAFIRKQFNPTASNRQSAKTGVSFDKLRAAVNLVVAAVLISFATSLTLPLSTTYVTFMVAMGTSLADRAWGRESAVYRITGVFSVIGGWFLTALSAFTIAFIVVNIISWGEIYAVAALLIIALLMIIRTHKLHNRKRKAEEIKKAAHKEITDNQSAIRSCSHRTHQTVNVINISYRHLINALFKEDRRKARNATQAIKQLNKELKDEQNNLGVTIQKLQEEGAETSHYYVQVISYLREIVHCLTYMAEPALNHIENSHKGLTPQQKEELDNIQNHLFNILTLAQEIIERNTFSKLDELIQMEHEFLSILKTARKNQIKRIKNQETGKKNSMLYLNILQETKNLSLNSVNLIKSHRDFVTYNDSDYF